MIPGVPAAGHVTARGGYWHPGRAEGCAKCEPDGRADRACPECGEVCRYDGWDLVHRDGLGIGSCRPPNAPRRKR